LATYLKEYRDHGIEGLKRWGYRGQASKLHKSRKNIEELLRENPPINSQHAQELIEKETKIRRSPTQIRAFMRSIGMRFRKVGSIPKGAEEKKKQREQKEFIKKNSSRPYNKHESSSAWYFF
jgi:transposase